MLNLDSIYELHDNHGAFKRDRSRKEDIWPDGKEINLRLPAKGKTTPSPTIAIKVSMGISFPTLLLFSKKRKRSLNNERIEDGFVGRIFDRFGSYKSNKALKVSTTKCNKGSAI